MAGGVDIHLHHTYLLLSLRTHVHLQLPKCLKYSEKVALTLLDHTSSTATRTSAARPLCDRTTPVRLSDILVIVDCTHVQSCSLT